MKRLGFPLAILVVLLACGEDGPSADDGVTGGSGASTSEGGSGGTSNGGTGGVSNGGTGGVSNAGSGGGSNAGSGGSNAGSGGTPNTGGSPGVGGSGHVVYRAKDGPIYHIESTEGALPFNLSAALDSISAGSDESVNVSPDGAWLAMISTRFGCDDWACVVVSDVELTQPSAVETVDGERIRPDYDLTIGSGGDVLVFVEDGVHQRDLFVMRKTGSAWSAPQNITEASDFAYNTQAAISDDGLTVLFDCSPTPYGENGAHICEVGTDGSGYKVLLGSEDSPNGETGTRVHSPDYAPDGSIVFEADWGTERIWRWKPGWSKPEQVGSFTNDNTPCVLPNGQVASLWLNSPNNPGGYHELKVMSPDGSQFVLLVAGLDILDSTIGCGL